MSWGLVSGLRIRKIYQPPPNFLGFLSHDFDIEKGY